MNPSRNILFICTQSPFSTDSGGQQRTHLIYEYLITIGHVHLVCITWDDQPIEIDTTQCTIHFWGINEQPYSNPLVGILTLFRFFYPNLEPQKHSFYQVLVHKIIQQTNPDFLVVRYLYPVFSCGLYQRSDLIVDIDDLPHEILMSRVKSEHGIGSKLMQALRMIHLNYHYKRCNANWKHAFVCQQDNLFMANSSYLPNVPLHVPNSKEVQQCDENNPVIAFVGSLSYHPNHEGVNHFLTHIWPIILRESPNAQFKIAGKGPQETHRWAEIRNVQVLGFVDDISTIYNTSNVIIAPIYSGSGTNIKVLEAMAWAKPCIISGYAARGLREHLYHAKNIFIAEDDLSFAKNLLYALKDPQMCNQIGEEARRTIQNYYTKDQFEAALSKVIF